MADRVNKHSERIKDLVGCLHISRCQQASDVSLGNCHVLEREREGMANQVLASWHIGLKKKKKKIRQVFIYSMREVTA